VVLQFVYSHCGVTRNEVADKLAGEANRDLEKDDPTPTWLTDFCSAKKLDIRRRRKAALSNIETQRTSLFEAKPTPLRALEGRASSVRLARIRVGETLEYGIARRRLLLDKSMMCRWCHPEAHVHEEEEPATVQASEKPKRSTDPHNCPVCGVSKPNLRHCRDHVIKVHGLGALPASWISQRSDASRDRRRVEAPPAPRTICPHCNEEKPRAHIPLCPSRQTPLKERVIPAALMPTDCDETLEHLLTRCPALQPLRLLHDICRFGEWKNICDALLQGDKRFLTFFDHAATLLH
jgi:hypothetical protein